MRPVAATILKRRTRSAPISLILSGPGASLTLAFEAAGNHSQSRDGHFATQRNGMLVLP
jgi:hypothetical protein